MYIYKNVQVEDWYCHDGWTALTRQRHSRDRRTNTERQTVRQVQITHVYKVLHFSLIGSLLSLFLSLRGQSSQSERRHDVQINQKLQIQYCITSKCYRDRCRQSSTTENVCFPWNHVCVFASVCVCLCSSHTWGLEYKSNRGWIFLPLCVKHSVELNLVRSRSNTNASDCDIMKVRKTVLVSKKVTAFVILEWIVSRILQVQ